MRRRFVLAALLAAATGVGAWAQTVETGGILTRVPNVEIRTYDISGRNPRDIRRSMDAVRPRDPADNVAVDAMSHWFIRWRWPIRRGGCDLSRAEVEFSGWVQLPRLSDAEHVPAPVLARWRAYLTALETHEYGHVSYAFAHVGDVLAAIRASDCDHAGEAAATMVRALAGHDRDYDRETRHGATQGAVFP